MENYHLSTPKKQVLNAKEIYLPQRDRKQECRIKKGHRRRRGREKGSVGRGICPGEQRTASG